jgi:DNA excision repair protein ERCC-4
MTQIKPTVVIDSREQTPLVFRNLASVPGTLTSGDYSFAGAEELFAVERKSIADLVMSVTTERERFTRELHRLRGFQFARLLIVGAEAEVATHRYRSNASPKSVLHSLAAFEARYNVPVVWQPDHELAAALVEKWAFWFHRELMKVADAVNAHQGEPISP